MLQIIEMYSSTNRSSGAAGQFLSCSGNFLMTNSGGLIGQALVRSVFALNSGYRIIQLVLQVDHDEQTQFLK